ncbi:MAG: uroporphyrinogen-III C-methyltransferase [Gammaproteobacteria bacterium]|nr:uroporphyrinogen-III C-methyltransferase [Gammaproteobacteria bacterium]
MLDESTPRAALPAPVSSSGAPRRGNRVAWLAISAVLALGVACVGWIKFEFEPLTTRVEDALASTDRSMTGALGELRGVADKVRTNEAAERTVNEQIKTLTARLATLAAEFAASNTRNGWRLARVEHLLRVAEDAVDFERDTSLAARALDAAAMTLGATNDRQELELKTALERDRDTLRAFQQPDVNALALEWSTTVTTIDALHWRAPEASLPQTSDPLPAKPVPRWQAFGASVWRALRSVIDVRDVSDADRALFDPGREALIKDALRLELGALRFATLRRDNVNVRAAAGTLATSLTRYFSTEDPLIAALTQRLAEIASLDLAPPLPDLNTSESALMALKTRVEPPGATTQDAM